MTAPRRYLPSTTAREHRVSPNTSEVKNQGAGTESWFKTTNDLPDLPYHEDWTECSIPYDQHQC